MILKVIALIVILIGVIFVYDARILSSKWFSFGDLNQATTRIKNRRFHFGNNWGFNNFDCIKFNTKNSRHALIIID